MIFGSVCSGIEAASVAWLPLGWRCAFMAETALFPRAVLAHHHPETPLHGDFTTIAAGQYEPIDVLVGGTPCQSFSIAGLRGGMADARGNLALEYLRLADRLRPRWLVWENVPGVLSANEGRDFGAFLGGVVELGYGFAYRVFDAQYFGLAQRRKRVFVVGYLGDWRRAAAVLFEPQSLRGNPSPCREAGQGTAAPITPGSPVGESETFVTHALRADGFDASEDGTGRGTPLVAVPVDLQSGSIGGDITGCLDTSTPSRGGGQAVAQAFYENVRGELRTSDIMNALSTGGGKPGQGYPAISVQITAPTNRSRAEDGRPAPTMASGSQMHVAYALGSHAGAADGNQTNQRHANGEPVGSGISEELAHSLRAGRNQSIAFQTSQSGVREHETHATLDANNGSRRHNGVVVRSAVRRLTPRECERLMGVPDGYTDVPYRSKTPADGNRYRALGNSMAVPVMAWIGRRIDIVDREGGAP